MADSKPLTFTEGRHKNRTYQQVFEMDSEFCKAVLSAPECNKYYPAKFKEFLLSQLAVRGSDTISTVCELGPKHFLQALTADMRSEFTDIVGQPEITVKEVHQPCDSKIPTSGFLGVFYRLFIQKCVFNIQGVDGYCKSVEKYASIFPFKISRNLVVRSSSLSVMHLFDHLFKQRIQNFLTRHFDDVLFDDIVPCFLSNIHLFRQQNFGEVEMKRLNNLMNVLQTDRDRVPAFRRGCGENRINMYLKTFPRLNKEGAQRFKNEYRLYKRICQQYDKPEVVSYTRNQLMSLPEINCHELFCLLNEEFFKENCIHYVYLFEKYLFFFVEARETNSQPVFFIDDMLFDCLKNLQTFRKSRDNVLNLRYELSMLTLVYRRKQPIEFESEISPNESNLIEVKNHIESLHGIKTALVESGVVTDLLECSIFMFMEDDGTCFDVRYSKISRRGISNFYESILIGALNPQIRRLVTYNAYIGQESSMDMPPIREKLQDFVRKYNRWDFSAQLPATKFLTWGLEHCFIENTIE